MSFDVDDILTQATTDELARLVCGDGTWHTSGIGRLGVRRVRVADGPHGLRVELGASLGESRPATCFPPAVGLASSWNPALLKRVGQALGREALPSTSRRSADMVTRTGCAAPLSSKISICWVSERICR